MPNTLNAERLDRSCDRVVRPDSSIDVRSMTMMGSPVGPDASPCTGQAIPASTIAAHATAVARQAC